MKNLILLALLSILIGCDARTVDTSSNYKLPDGLLDCKTYTVYGDGLTKTLYVIRCPSSQTTTNWNEQQGKSQTTISSTVVE